MSELERAVAVYAESGWDRGVLENRDIAHLVASGGAIVSRRGAEGLSMQAEETVSGIRVAVRVKEGAAMKHPVHLCFGIRHEEGLQEIVMGVTLERDASANFIAHCLFPKARKVRHVMDASIAIGEGARMRYSEAHYHGESGGIEVVPRAVVKIADRGEFLSDFLLTRGRVGKLEIDYAVEASQDSVAELVARVFAHGRDEVRIREKIVLAGRNARGLVKARLVLEDDSSAEVIGISEGNAAGARGHVDCVEVVKDRAIARAIPIVNVRDPLAKVTHEAAIGTVDRKALETLMAHGLTPDEAVGVIVTGILR